MPNNMTKAGIKYGANGGSMKKKKVVKKMNMGGGSFIPPTMGAGDGDMTPYRTGMDVATLGKERMNSYAAGGGLMGFGEGGDVMEKSTYGNGGSTKRGNKRKGKKPGSRLAYD